MHIHNRTFHWLVRVGFVIALALTLFFGVRTIVSAVYWNDPAHRDQRIEGWMPPGYISQSWHVPPEVLAQALGLASGSLPHRSLERIARDRAIPLPELIARLRAAIQTFRESHP